MGGAMKTSRGFWTLRPAAWVVAAIFCCAAVGSFATAPAAAPGPAQPLRFEENRGQWASPMRFQVRGAGAAIAVTDRELVVAGGPGAEPARIRFAGQGPRRVVGFDALQARANYFLGKDPKGWRTNVPCFSRVLFEEVFPGIDAEFYGREGRLEFDFRVRAGADPSRIRIAYRGGRGLVLDDAGGIMLGAGEGAIRQLPPTVYQGSGESRQLVPGRFVRTSADEVSFRPGAYDRTRELVVDPVLAFSTYLGGTKYDFATAVATGADGAIYIAGHSNSVDFPTTPGAYRTSIGGGTYAFVSKFSPDGQTLIYSTYVGGGSEELRGIAVEPSGAAYITGRTSSTGYPVLNAFQASRNGTADAFVTKMAPAGDALVYSTFLGGSGSWEYGQGIAVDGQGQAVVAGYTESTDFPTQAPLQATSRGANEVFVTKFSADGRSVLFSTYLGGDSNDAPASVRLDGQGRPVVGGSTSSTNFPTANAWQAASGGGSDFFVAKLLADGSGLVYSTYLGGNNNENIYGLAIDAAGSACVAGGTTYNFPVLHAAQATPGGNADAAVAKFSDTGTLLWATYLGGAGGETAACATVDGWGRLTVAGFTASPDFPTLDPVQADIGSSWLYHSEDGGATFSKASRLPFQQAGGLAFDPSDATHIYAGAYGLSAADHGIYSSSDSGASWTHLTNGRLAVTLSVAVGGGAVYQGTWGDGCYKSLDGGSTWNPAKTGMTNSTVNYLAQHPSSPATLYACTQGGLFVTTNGAGTWTAVPGFSGSVTCLAFAPSNPAVIYAGLGGGNTIMKSGDGGATWNPVNAGLPTSASVTCLAVDPTEPSTVYLGLGNQYLRKTTDGGATWTPILATWLYGISDIAVDPQAVSRAFISGSYGVFRSEDGGTTWTSTVLSGAATLRMALSHASPSGPLRLVVGSAYPYNGFLVRYAPDGSALEYGTFLGGIMGAIPGGVAADANGSAVVVGKTTSVDFPSVDAYQPALQSTGDTGWWGDATVTKLRTCTLACSASGPSQADAGVPASFSVTATPSDCLSSLTYEWDFGDGTAPSTQQSPSHSYASSGPYTWSVTAKALDVTCTKTGAVTVTSPCSLTCTATVPLKATEGLAVSFSATATPTGCSGTPTYDWNFGDGLPHGTSASANHVYASHGTYTWILTVSVGPETCTKTGTVTVVDGPVITLLKKMIAPFRIVVTGSNLQSGMRVFINGVEWASVTQVSSIKYKVVGGASLKAKVPKGVPTVFRFLNPDGGEAYYTFQY